LHKLTEVRFVYEYEGNMAHHRNGLNLHAFNRNVHNNTTCLLN